jgi:hypothetical protein
MVPRNFGISQLHRKISAERTSWDDPGYLSFASRTTRVPQNTSQCVNERCALKSLRGDFQDMPPLELCDAKKAEQIVDAMRRWGGGDCLPAWGRRQSYSLLARGQKGLEQFVVELSAASDADELPAADKPSLDRRLAALDANEHLAFLVCRDRDDDIDVAKGQLYGVQ